MDLSTKQRTVIIVVFALYTAALLLYSLVTRKAMQKGKGDYLSKFYTGGRSGGIIITAMMVSAGVAGAGVFMGVPGFFVDLDSSFKRKRRMMMKEVYKVIPSVRKLWRA